ncbi:MAG: ribonuclease HII [Candidatus Adiutrix sp.]|jgi:ribonuclease HII|nr:ribonuclease HII [Candidatus Adiutrix sp.]
MKKSYKNNKAGQTEDLAAFDQLFRVSGGFLAGTDEAGRGPLAGPLAAAAVILDPFRDYPGVVDSKKMSASARDKAYALITLRAVSWACAVVEAAEVDRLNPLEAAMLAMRRAVLALDPPPDLVLVDGASRPDLPMKIQTLVKGDARSLSIAAASVIAKVTRDRIMDQLHEQYPQYGFDRNKGYGVAEHLKALRLHGPSPCHRLSFRGVNPPKAAPLFSDRGAGGGDG